MVLRATALLAGNSFEKLIMLHELWLALQPDSSSTVRKRASATALGGLLDRSIAALWRSLTCTLVEDDVLAQQVVVAQDHGGAQQRQALLHPQHLLPQTLCARNLLGEPGRTWHPCFTRKHRRARIPKEQAREYTRVAQGDRLHNSTSKRTPLLENAPQFLLRRDTGPT